VREVDSVLAQQGPQGRLAPHRSAGGCLGRPVFRVLHRPDGAEARNLEHHAALTVVTGTNAWQAGLDEVFDSEGVSAHVFGVTPTKVLAFAKSPHRQTRYRF
jgi:hypothetical protein